MSEHVSIEPTPVAVNEQDQETALRLDLAIEPFMYESVEVKGIDLDYAMTITGPSGLSRDDYEVFVGGGKRAAVKSAYLHPGVDGLLPRTDYPLLDIINTSYDEQGLADKVKDQQEVDLQTEPYAVLRAGNDETYMVDKTKAEYNRIQRAYMRVISALESGEIVDETKRAVAELTIKKQEYEMTKLRMIAAAKELNWSQNAGSRHLAAEVFKESSETLYGKIDRSAINGIAFEELLQVSAYEPRTEEERDLQEHTIGLLRGILGVDRHDHIEINLNNELVVNGKVVLRKETPESPETSIKVEKLEIDDETFTVMTPIVLNKFQPALDAWPEVNPDQILGSEQMVRCFESALTAMGLTELGCRVVLVDNSSYIEASGPDRVIKIGKNINTDPKLGNTYDSAFAFTVFAHEFGHLVRSVETQVKAPEVGTLINGTPNYLAAEEGLNAFTQLVILKHFGREPRETKIWQDRYLVYALASGADGHPRAAFETLKDSTSILAMRELMGSSGITVEQAITKAAGDSYGHTERFFRGTLFSDPGIIYSKDKVYYDGLIKNIRLFKHLVRSKSVEETVQLYDRMYLGKHDHTDEEEHSATMKVFKIAA